MYVDIITSVNSPWYQEINTYPMGKKSIHQITKHREEFSRSNILVKYFSSSNVAAAWCGCSVYSASLRCDSFDVCGGNMSTVDCAKVSYGSAYVDSCGICAGGQTGITPKKCYPSIYFPTSGAYPFFTHSLIYSFTHSLTHPLTHLLTHS